MIKDVNKNRFLVLQAVTVSTAAYLRAEFASDVNALLTPRPLRSMQLM